MKKILVLFAHPAIGRSEINRPMLGAARRLDGVTVVDLYAEYPDFDINIDQEQERLLAHDVIVFQFPLYWYSTPSLLKEWQDLVLEYGFAYGKGGNKLAGKVFLTALTAGGSKEAYQKTGDNLFTIRELLQPLEQTAHLCQMTYLPPFVLFRSRSAQAEGRVASHVTEWTRLLTDLRDQQADVPALRSLDRLR
ncbi:MAG: NAD(P)H-dependent oxidoreductase [Burkholderiaceae bacterium]